MSNLPWIVMNGGAAFAALGEGRSAGTRLFSVSGHVKRPANYEVEMAKVSFRDLMYDPELGGGIRDDCQLKAFVPGGVSAPWFGPDQVDMALDQDAVGKAGSMLGSGSVVVMDDTTCMVRAAWRITRFFHRESCGQCTPCREGGWLDKIMRRIELGQDREADLVDGKLIEAKQGEMVIAAAERGGVYIPRFCWHPRMRPVGMCRMCWWRSRAPVASP